MDKDFNFYKKKGFLVKKKLINLNLVQEINKIILKEIKKEKKSKKKLKSKGALKVIIIIILYTLQIPQKIKKS